MLAWIEEKPTGNLLVWRQAIVTRKNLDRNGLTMSRAAERKQTPVEGFQHEGEFTSAFVLCKNCNKSHLIDFAKALEASRATGKPLVCDSLPD
ncbi:hypothetical protein [Microcella alkalica]|uniref:hypothetical protein n=1 Tax=Microcella alkalica TaxID=355930 RepID=UPI00145F705A|nr:hypothetical protein [Microcella alkalica]